MSVLLIREVVTTSVITLMVLITVPAIILDIYSLVHTGVKVTI